MSENKIWDWFSENKEKLEKFLESDTADISIYNTFCDKINAYSDLVFPEITGDGKGNYILVLTCDGISQGIPFVEKLGNAAPEFKNWSVKCFRQPGYASNLSYDGLEFSEKDIKITYTPVTGNYDIKIYIKNYDDGNDNYKSLAFLYLDHYIGEYNVMTRIGNIDFRLLRDEKDLLYLNDFLKILKQDIN